MNIDPKKVYVPLGAVGAAVVLAWGGLQAADERYEQKGKVEQLREQMVEDKVFELQLIPEAKRTDAQRAMLERYKAQLEAMRKEK